jgi:hypothetical protein
MLVEGIPHQRDSPQFGFTYKGRAVDVKHRRVVPD